MESQTTTQTAVAPPALAERLTQLEAATPGVIDRLVKLATREVGLDAIPFGQDTGKDEPGAEQPMTIRQKREATLKDPFIEQIAQWFRGLGTSEKLAAFMLQTCLSADQSSNGDIPVGLNELANVIIREYSDTFEQTACHLFEQSPGQSIEGLGAVAFVIEQMQR